MAISSEDLPRHLASGLKPLYVVFGDALLLASEAADSIRTAARAAGYTERETFFAEQHFKWTNCATARKSVVVRLAQSHRPAHAVRQARCGRGADIAGLLR